MIDIPIFPLAVTCQFLYVKDIEQLSFVNHYLYTFFDENDHVWKYSRQQAPFFLPSISSSRPEKQLALWCDYVYRRSKTSSSIVYLTSTLLNFKDAPGISGCILNRMYELLVSNEENVYSCFQNDSASAISNAFLPGSLAEVTILSLRILIMLTHPEIFSLFGIEELAFYERHVSKLELGPKIEAVLAKYSPNELIVELSFRLISNLSFRDNYLIYFRANGTLGTISSYLDMHAGCFAIQSVGLQAYINLLDTQNISDLLLEKTIKMALLAILRYPNHKELVENSLQLVKYCAIWHADRMAVTDVKQLIDLCTSICFDGNKNIKNLIAFLRLHVKFS